MSAEPAPNPDDPTRVMQTPGAAREAFIGPYRLLRQIGEGGMGVVFQAQQLQPIRREVALKIIKPGMDTEHVVARFESERQALAVMDHPNIARVFDAGTTTAGLPYFVMELVDGIPITRYSNSKRLAVRQRIELFIPVCDAIQHAHQKGIIHRDIKPSNILVAEQDGKAVPKVIDFGLAKALGQQLSDATIMMCVGTVVGTLDYMSPEQAEVTRHDVDTRSDVYSLGAVLYELLTGTTPLERERLTKTGYAEVLQRIRDEEAPPPSARLRSSSTSAEIAAQRQSDPARLPKLLHGELDWIAMKALDKDRKRRYETASALARDLERYLAGEPVEAAPPSAAYLTFKFVSRHRTSVIIAGAMASLLIGSTVAVVRESHVARQERDRSQRRFNDVRQLAHSVIFDLEGRIAALPGSTPVRRDLIATAIAYVDRLAGEAGEDWALEKELAEAYLRIGEVQGSPNSQNLGESQAALESFRKAEQIARKLVAARPSFDSRKLLVEALLQPANLHYFAGENGPAKAEWNEALAIARDLNVERPENDDAKFLLAASLRGLSSVVPDAQCLAHRLEALQLFESLLRAKPADPSRQRNAALIHKQVALMKGIDDPLPHLQRAMELDELRVASDPSPLAKLDVSFDYSQFSEYYRAKGDLAKAGDYMRRTLAIRREVAGADAQDVWKQDRLQYALTSAAELQLMLGDTRGAMDQVAEARTISERLARSNRMRKETDAYTLLTLGKVRQKMGDRQGACAAYLKGRELYGGAGRSDDFSRDLERAFASCGAISRSR